MENKTTESVMNKKNNEEVEEEEENMVQLLLLPPYLYLDENIITQILLKIPAEILFNTIRYVCKSWLKIISTHPCIHLNRLIPSKPPCLITQTPVYGESPLNRKTTIYFFTLTKEGMVKEQFDDLIINPPFRSILIRSCCNGLILAFAQTDEDPDAYNLYVVNPLTNYRLRLPYPPQFERVGYYYAYASEDFKLLFIPSTGEYKVILVSEKKNNNCLQILTLSAGDCYYGSNDRLLLQWRLIEAPYEIRMNYITARNNYMFYWGTVIDGGKRMDIISFDASVEKFDKTTYHPYPRCYNMGLIEMGGLLSCWCRRPTKCNKVRISFHVVKNFHEGEWIKKYKIKIDEKFGCPILSFGNGEVLIFDNANDNINKKVSRSSTMWGLWVLNVKLNQWWKVQEISPFCISLFSGYNKPVPLESIFSSKVSGAFKKEEEEEEKDSRK